MTNTKALIDQAYAAFNRRDIDGVLALMTEDISWPRPLEGGRAIGKEEIRAYWTRQWTEYDPHVNPVEVTEGEGGRTDVKVHQLVKNLSGDVLTDQMMLHVYSIKNGLIERMDVHEWEGHATTSHSVPSSLRPPN